MERGGAFVLRIQLRVFILGSRARLERMPKMPGIVVLSAIKPPEPPKELSSAGAQQWRTVMRRYRIDEPDTELSSSGTAK